MKKALISFGFVVTFILVVYAATFTTTSSGGWSTGGTWVGGSVPGNNGNHTVNVNHAITSTPATLQGFTAINVNNGVGFTSTGLTLNNVNNFTVNSGNITINGNLTLTNGTTLTVTSGNVTVTGTLTMTGGSSLIYNGSGTVSIGTYATSGSGGTLDINSGALTVTNSMTLNSGHAFELAQNATATLGSFTSSNNTDAVINNSGSLTILGAANPGGPINNLSTGNLQINGSVTMSNSNSAVFTNSGILNIDGSVTVPSSAKFRVNPGGTTFVDTNFNVSANENLVIGTSTAPPPYADMVIKGNLSSTSSGDVKIDRNGRFAVYGNVTATGGGTLFTVENGGQTYIHGNINFSGGGSDIINNNTVDPFGLYVNGTITNSGGGSGTDPNTANQATMIATNPTFTSWVAAQPGSPLAALPISLRYFIAAPSQPNGIPLQWVTDMEKNFDYFSVQSSSDGLIFKEIGRVKGNGESRNAIHYSFVDTKPIAGRNYYRLKSVDFDDQYEYSQIITSVWNGSIGGISLYPNPTTNRRVRIAVSDEISEIQKIVLFDQAGKMVWENSISLTIGEIEFPETLKSGVYFISLFTKTGKRTTKVILQ